MNNFSKKISILTFCLTFMYAPGIRSMERVDVAPEGREDAPERARMTINSITPIQPGMSREEARQSIIDFFKKNISIQKDIILDSQILKKEWVQENPEGGFYVLQVIRDRTQPVQRRIAGTGFLGNENSGRSFILTTLADGTQWVQGDKGLERFLGATYLKKALEHHHLTDKWRVVPTKFFLSLNEVGESITINIKSSDVKPLINVCTISSENFTSFSQYAGPDQIAFEETLPTEELKNLTGFADSFGNANFLRQEGTRQVTIIDTEYSSFEKVGPTQPTDRSETDLGKQPFIFTLDELFPE